ncbi:MAG: recombination-associated protein RdgC [Syntrophales bacterium]
MRYFSRDSDWKAIMGLLKGTLTFSRYRVAGDLPPDFPGFVNRQIRKYSFQDIARGVDEISMGWTSIENVLDTAFEYANYAQGDYLLFALRIDRRKVPASLLRIKTRQAEKEYLAETGQKRLYTDKRRDIKEAVRLELLSRSLPTPSLHDVCWCVSKKWLIFGTNSEGTAELFEKLFEQTFHLKLLPFRPWDPDNLDQAIEEKMASLERSMAIFPEKQGAS